MRGRQIAKEDCRDLDRALSLKWLETNGRGGFSSGTVAGANTRRYHALLLTARKPPGERFVLVNQVEEWMDLDGQSFPLSTNCYPGGCQSVRLSVLYRVHCRSLANLDIRVPQHNSPA